MDPQTEKPPPIIIYRLGSLGDTIVSLPCFHAILKRYPATEKIALTNVPISSVAAPLESILRPGGFIQGVISYPVGARSVRELWDVRRRIRETGARTLVYMASTRSRFASLRDYLFFKLCGMSEVLCLPLAREKMFNRIDAGGAEEREAERLARCMGQEFEIDLADPASWDLRLTRDELSNVAEAAKPLGGTAYFVVNMGGKAAVKDWGADNWKALLSNLGNSLGRQGVVVVGAAEDRERADTVAAVWPGKRLNLCGDLSPRETFGIMQRALFFVGHDSGPLHLAAAAQIPCVGLFGAFNKPRKWHPIGKRHVIIHEMHGVKAISVQRVLDAVSQSAGLLEK